jgi:hypothetical protein
VPELVTDRTTTYDYLDRATQADEIVKDSAGVTKTRTTATAYLNSGNGDRVSTVTVTGGLGAAVPTTTTSYDTSTGLVTTVSAATTTENAATSATTGYDDFGRVITYNEANEATGAAVNSVTTTYDTAGRVSTVSDAHTARTYTYNAGNEHRGLTTGLAVTVTGSSTFTGSYTAGYDSDGAASSQTDPNGIATSLSKDETGTTITQLDTKISDGSTWLLDSITAPTIHGETLAGAGPVGVHSYAYDKIGRLTAATAAPTGGACTTRIYALDADSNRTSSTAYPADADGSCQWATGGVATSHSYDAADRLQSGVSTPASPTTRSGAPPPAPPPAATSPSVTTSVTWCVPKPRPGSPGPGDWTRPAGSRPLPTPGPAAPVRVNHYNDSSSDSPSWIAENSAPTTWTANIGDLLGGLGATVDQTGAATMQYGNMHGDIVAACAVGASSPTLSSDYDEYGNPADGQTRRYGWLGGKQRSGDSLGSPDSHGRPPLQPHHRTIPDRRPRPRRHRQSLRVRPESDRRIRPQRDVEMRLVPQARKMDSSRCQRCRRRRRGYRRRCRMRRLGGGWLPRLGRTFGRCNDERRSTLGDLAVCHKSEGQSATSHELGVAWRAQRCSWRLSGVEWSIELEHVAIQPI